MRWTAGQRSGNIEDRRGQSGRGLQIGGGLGAGGAIILLILSLVFKQDLTGMLGGSADPSAVADQSAPITASAAEEREVDFVSFVLDDAQTTWAKIFRTEGRSWQDAKLVLFRDATETACGYGQSASGPFYCPGDHKVYLDLAFFEELHARFGASGDFAEAYVIAHELGHHVQALLGTEAQVRRAGQGNPGGVNALSVRLELQADCYAGVWANSTSQRDILDKGDVDEGLAAAASVGDDRLQRQQTGRVNPDAFTHGTSAERMRWFQQGFTKGRMEACDTFSG